MFARTVASWCLPLAIPSCIPNNMPIKDTSQKHTQSLLPTLISSSSQLTPLNPTQTRSSQHKSVQNQPTKLALSGQLYSQFSPQQEPSQLHALCHRTKLALSSTINPTPNTHSYRRTLNPTQRGQQCSLSLSEISRHMSVLQTTSLLFACQFHGHHTKTY